MSKKPKPPDLPAGRLRVIFMGSPEFAARILYALIEADICDIVAAYSRPPRPARRGQAVRLTPVAALTQEHHIALHTPEYFSPDEIDTLKTFAADMLLVVAYGLLLPKAVLDAVPRGGVNIHASLLPRWRGSAPIQQAILAGDAETGITLMQMDEGLDTGDILRKHAIALDEHVTASQLHDELSALAAVTATEFLRDVAKGVRMIPTPQDESLACHAPKLTREHGAVDFARDSACEIERKIRALTPWPGAWLDHHRMRLMLHQAAIVDAAASDADVPVGTIVDVTDGITVRCAKGFLRIDRLKRSGGRVLTAREFLNGYSLSVGQKLGSHP